MTRYRQLRKLDTGQWIDVLFTVQAQTDAPNIFTVKPEQHQAQLAAGLGLLPAALEVLDADTDLRVGLLLALPPPTEPPPSDSAIRRSRITELLAIPRSDWTVAQYRELLQLVAQEQIQ